MVISLGNFDEMDSIPLPFMWFLSVLFPCRDLTFSELVRGVTFFFFFLGFVCFLIVVLGSGIPDILASNSLAGGVFCCCNIVVSVAVTLVFMLASKN